MIARMRSRLHAPLRNSSAPYLQALLRGFGRGLTLIGVEAAASALYLGRARGGWVDYWAGNFGLRRRAGESDEALRARLTSTALGRMDTRGGAIEAAILDQTGARATLIPSVTRVAHFDQLERMLDGHFMADFASFATPDGGGRWSESPWGEFDWPQTQEGRVVFDDTPPTHLSYRGLTPLRPGWGPSGMLIVMSERYDPQLERDVLWSIRDNIPAALGFDLMWGHTFAVTLGDGLYVEEGATLSDSGWGVDPWGDSPWG